MEMPLELSEYAICFPNEYTEDIVIDVGKVANIEIDMERLNTAMQNDGSPGEECVCVFRDLKDKRCFILIDCQNSDYLYGIVVRCYKKDSDRIKHVLSKWRRSVREDYGQEVQEELADSINNEKSLFNAIVRVHRLKIDM